MDKTRRLHSCAVITTSSSSVVLVCGGVGRSDCEIYNPDTNSWTNGPSLPSTLSGSAMVAASPTSSYAAFILGGYDGQDPQYHYSNRIYGILKKDLTKVALVGTMQNKRYLPVSLKMYFC